VRQWTIKGRIMLTGFFLKLKSTRLPVSIKEWLTLLEAMQKGVISPSIDEFYYLSRTTLVKDEQNFDKFDRAFGEYFKGIESVAGVEFDVPLEWLLKQVELNLSPEGAPEELDLDTTIDKTARNAGVLDLSMRPERHNAVKVLMFLDIGGSMDDHVKLCEELFSAAKTEFKHLEYFYFHNCLYDTVW